MSVKEKRRKLVPEMNGRVARWYAANRGSEAQMKLYPVQAASLAEGLPEGTDILEVAPGPGYHAIELAKLGHRVTGLDVSTTFVEIATEGARGAGVEADFRHGDVADMPFADGSFDLIICQAAFKNFALPLRALDEMHRVLRPGGRAVIQDMNHDATSADIAEEVTQQGHPGWFAAFSTRAALNGLRRRAYTPAQFTELARESAFRDCEITTAGIGLDVRLTKTS